MAVLLAAFGQRRFNLEPTPIGEGLLFYLLAALSLVAARVALRPPVTTSAERDGEAIVVQAWPYRPGMTWRWGVTLIGIALCGVVLAGLHRIPEPSPPTTSYAIHFWAWIAAIVLVAGPWLVAWRFEQGWWTEARTWIRTHRWEMAALGIITLLGAWLRFYNLGSAPFSISGDEGSIGLEIQRVLSGDLQNPFSLMWGTHSTMVGFIMAGFARLFGFSVDSLRVMSALVGTAAIPALFVLAWHISGRRVALIAALLLATFPYHLHYSRVALPIAWDTFTYPAALGAFWWGMRRDSQSLYPFALAGLIGGFGQYPYTGSRLLPILIGIFLLTLALFEREWLRRKGSGLIVMALVFLVVASPHYLTGLRDPDAFNARLNQVGILQNGWLEAESAIRGEGELLILWDQFRRALFGFAFFDDRTSTWGPGTPLAPPLLSLGLFFGLAVSLRRWREPGIWLLHGWFWAVILTGGVLTLDPPSSNRLVAITPVVSLFAAAGWNAVATALASALPSDKRSVIGALVAGLLVGATALAGVYAHQRYLDSNRFGGNEALIATMVGRDLAQRPQNTTLIMLTPPRLYADISPLALLTPGYHRHNVTEPLTAPLVNLPASGDLMFVILPERAEEMHIILQTFPQAQPREVHAPDNAELLYHQIVVDQ